MTNKLTKVWEKKGFFSFYNPNELKFEPLKEDEGIKEFNKMYQKYLAIRYKIYRI